ncbi:MAG: nucleotidyltransferase domain-containing protein [Nanoarchaeota archaeon]
MNSVINSFKKSLVPERDFLSEMTSETKEFIKLLEGEIRKQKARADVFIGGSFVKGTMLKSEKYDVDIFVRFNSEDKILGLEKIISKVVKKIGKKCLKVHGSRDYFQIDMGEFCFEVVPVLKISRPKDALNVTDLSYFHVNYVKRKARGLEGEIRLAKAFFKASGVYGAESYIQGFSGYGVECLIIHYKSFLKMLKSIVSSNEQIIIDSGKHYRNSREVLIELNESKRKGPIVLVDPTFKERNVLAALNKESFDKVRELAGRFLKAPSERFFIADEINLEALKRKAVKAKAELLVFNIETQRQAGDIAGTKMKKFSRFVERYLEKQYSILASEFDYSGADKAKVYFIVKPKKEVILRGPPAFMSEYVGVFRKKHRNAVLKRGRWYASAKVGNAQDYAELLIKDKKILEQMDISKVELEIV